MAERKTSSRRRLTPDDWADAALAAIADGGLAAVAVEPLAARLGTTKGSFYWHFSNREALLEAALARWEARTTTAVIDEIVNATDDPASQLRRLIIRVSRMAEVDRVGPALLATAAHPAVARAVERVTRARVGLIVTALAQLGFAPSEAQSRALLAYSAYLGHTQLAHSAPASYRPQ
ncbi:TetR/AcrR family transcriptional regulator [Phytohabitans rumicis]|uniref:TetR family transcriptional regulator n=1 Tax=Phytohabitans rumicis TaxID=1076125 RepID=A0A6V8LC16_9ACTN|nr:TetR/AcrR family transcriptional regulator [Phytohabitans rumicis]GFJ91597.1 TetR family transcriptional regulator [Phytohabitans rumicis]